MSNVAPEHRRDQARSAYGYLPIEHHGIIGDLHSVALVGIEGTIDWFCPERFDWAEPVQRCSTTRSAATSRSAS